MKRGRAATDVIGINRQVRLLPAIQYGEASEVVERRRHIVTLALSIYVYILHVDIRIGRSLCKGFHAGYEKRIERRIDLCFLHLVRDQLQCPEKRNIEPGSEKIGGNEISVLLLQFLTSFRVVEQQG